MSERQDFRRTPTYYHSQDYDEIIRSIGQERWNFLTADIFKLLFLDPSFEVKRQVFGNMLWELHNNPSEAQEAGYDPSDVMISIMVLQELSTSFGIILGSEIKQIQEGKRVEIIDPSPKYSSWDSLVEQAREWREQRGTIGIAHGAFDPPHVSHSRLYSKIWPYCDHLIVGFDSNRHLRSRKGEDRPRFPQLAWRMWEVTSLPTVDKVFVLPIDPVEDVEKQFVEIYKTLGVTVMGTSDDNVLLPQYKERMDKLGGMLISGDPERWSSTKMMANLSDKEIARNALIDLEEIQKYAQDREKLALAAGFLKDLRGEGQSQ